MVNKQVINAETSHVGLSLQTCKQMGCLKAHKTKENLKDKIPAAFQGFRNGTFSLQACKLYAAGLLSSARLKGSDLKKVHTLFVI